MSKAILVLDEMPECCADCSCSFFERDNPKLNLICSITQEDANNVGKPDWCPLKEIPEPMKDKCNKSYNKMYKAGWNDCIEEIIHLSDR